MKAISDKMKNGLNRQITAEFESAYLYLDMANCLEDRNFSGMARWFRLQADEEKRHALKINDYMLERGLVPELGEITAPRHQWSDEVALLEEAYHHECHVSNMIYDLVAQAMEDKDFASVSFLQWFVDEQVEEEEHSLKWLEKARLFGGNAAGLMILDGKMGKRTPEEQKS
ncbi:MAG: ferritin [Alphaproteobacteria bacterium]|nr:ferritin [Alphaproteobacteria bacterium]